MEATELRIGNYVMNEHSKILTVLGIKETSLYLYEKYKSQSGSYFIEKIWPIPLTEEWLLKFGFEKIAGYLWKCKQLGEQRFIENHLTKGYFETHYESKHIQYVHQLQNLYFALTNEELEII